MNPSHTETPTAPGPPTGGRASVTGATPRIEPQITRLRPMRSPIGPPTIVPTAVAARKTNRHTCAEGISIPKRWFR